MFGLSANNLVLILSIVILGMGVIAFIVGIFTLAFKINSEDFNEISSQTAKMMNKGISEDVSTMVGNASSLLQSINEMAKTKAGVGMFLLIVAFILIGSAYFLITRIP
jgi:hypothetical protein